MAQGSLRFHEEDLASQKNLTYISTGQEADNGSPPAYLRRSPLLARLLAAEPVQATRWVIEALKNVVFLPKGNEQVAAEPLLQLCSEFKDAPLEEMKEAIAYRLVLGFAGLPARERVDVVRMTLRIAAGRKQVLLSKGVLVLPMPAAKEAEARALRNDATEEDLALLASIVNPTRADLAYFYLAIAVDRTAFDRITPAEGYAVARAAVEALVQVPVMEALEMAVQLVTELDEVERRQLIVIVREDDDLCEAHQEFTARCVQPGGYADMLLEVIRAGNGLTTYFIIASLVAVGEILLAEFLPRCGTPLNAWLLTDALLWLIATGTAWYVGHEVRPIITNFLQSKWLSDDDASSHRLGSDAGDLETGSNGSVQSISLLSDKGAEGDGELPEGACRIGTVGGVCALALLAGFLAAVVAIIEVLFSFKECEPELLMFTSLFSVLRLSLTVSLALWIWALFKEFRLAYSLFCSASEAADGSGQAQPAGRVSTLNTPMVKGNAKPAYGSVD